MEPDPGGPGNVQAGALLAKTPRRFNGARPRRAWKPLDLQGANSAIGKLQWSQTPEGLETPAADAATARGLTASMEPDPGGPGNCPEACHRTNGLGASMEPDPGGPGNSQLDYARLAYDRLQWSQTPEGLETSGSRVCINDARGASMEPDPGGPGNRPVHPARDALPWGFNGARPRRAWKRVPAMALYTGARLLQWSQTPEGLETTQLDEEATRLKALQWSQTPEGLETATGAGGCGIQKGASMEPDPGGPGNTVSVLLALTSGMLQWSQTPEGLETSLFQSTALRRIQLQWSQTPEGLETGYGKYDSIVPRKASMEPDPGGPGNFRGLAPCGRRGLGFNGARPRRAWKRLSIFRNSNPQSKLQWSQTPEGLETLWI